MQSATKGTEHQGTEDVVLLYTLLWQLVSPCKRRGYHLPTIRPNQMHPPPSLPTVGAVQSRAVASGPWRNPTSKSRRHGAHDAAVRPAMEEGVCFMPSFSFHGNRNANKTEQLKLECTGHGAMLPHMCLDCPLCSALVHNLDLGHTAKVPPLSTIQHTAVIQCQCCLTS